MWQLFLELGSASEGGGAAGKTLSQKFKTIPRADGGSK